MSVLRALAAQGDFDSEPFIAQIAANFIEAGRVFERSDKVLRDAEQRAKGMRLSSFERLARIGEVLLMVQEAKASQEGGFEGWFEEHQEGLGFCRATAYNCLKIWRTVLEHGLERAHEIAIEKSRGAVKETMRVPLELDGIKPERALELFTKVEPVYMRLRDIVGANAAGIGTTEGTEDAERTSNAQHSTFNIQCSDLS